MWDIPQNERPDSAAALSYAPYFGNAPHLRALYPTMQINGGIFLVYVEGTLPSLIFLPHRTRHLTHRLSPFPSHMKPQSLTFYHIFMPDN
jgi:hypothetical protein